MVVLGHGDVVEETYEFLEYGVFDEEGHLFNFAHEDRICKNGGIKNACIGNG